MEKTNQLNDISTFGYFAPPLVYMGTCGAIFSGAYSITAVRPGPGAGTADTLLLS